MYCARIIGEIRVIDRRKFIASAAGTLVAASLSADAQQPERLRRIGILSVDSPIVPAVTCTP